MQDTAPVLSVIQRYFSLTLKSIYVNTQCVLNMQLLCYIIKYVFE